MSYFEFPHTRNYEGDLGYVIKSIIDLTREFKDFKVLNTIKLADPTEWDITRSYEPNTIVFDSDASVALISKCPVPAGIDLTNTDYWQFVCPLSIDGEARTEIVEILKFITNSYESGDNASQNYAVGDHLIWKGKLYIVAAAISSGAAFVDGTNINETTIEEMIKAIRPVDSAFSYTSMNAIANKPVTEKFATVQANIASVNSDVQNAIADISALQSDITSIDSQVTANTNGLAQEIIDRQTEDGLLSDRIDAIGSLAEGSTTGDAELMDIRTSEQQNVYTNAGTAVRAQVKKNQDTSTFQTYTRALLVNNGWINNAGVNPQVSDSWQYSNAIDISAFAMTQLYINFTATGFNNGSIVVNNIAFFDTNDVFLFGIHHPSASSETTYSQTIELPKYAKYMRICSKNDNTKPFYVSLFKKQSMIAADACSVYDKYIGKEIMYVTNDDGYLDTSGTFHAAPAATWHASPFKYVAGFNRVFFKLNINNTVAGIALYREDQSCIRVISGDSGSYAYKSGTLDVSEATYIKYCFHNDYTDTNIDNHVILFNEAEYNKFESSNFHLVNKPLTFSGKNAVFFGDSITEGVVTPGIVTPNGYPTVLSGMLGMSYTNKGVSGASVYRVSGYPCIYDTVAATDLTGVDYVFLMGGSNDWQLGVSASDFKSGLNDILGLLSSFTGEIIFIAPIDTTGRKPINPPACDLEDIRQVMKEVAMTNDLSFINGKLFDMPTAHSSQAYIGQMFGDTIHPSEAGYKLIARGLRNALI